MKNAKLHLSNAAYSPTNKVGSGLPSNAHFRFRLAPNLLLMKNEQKKKKNRKEKAVIEWRDIHTFRAAPASAILDSWTCDSGHISIGAPATPPLQPGVKNKFEYKANGEGAEWVEWAWANDGTSIFGGEIENP